VIAIYAVLLGPSVYFALKVPQDNSIDRLIVKSDEDYQAARAFEKVFGSAEYVILLAEADDPFAPSVLARVDELEQKLASKKGVIPNSALSIYRRAKAGFTPSPEGAADFKRFLTGTSMFRRQGLFGDHFLSIPIVLKVDSSDTEGRARILHDVESVIAPVEKSPAPLSRLRKVGQPFVTAYLDRDTREAGTRYFPLFFLFVIVLNVALYRSWRALLAFIATLGVSAAMTVGFVGLTGGVFTIVSQLVPMTILIVCTATLVYLHSRFVEHPAEDGRTAWEHQIFSLCNKFLATTASIFAAAAGFAALAVSKIRPIREMGIWVAVGLMITWLAVFTLFPALQRALNTPTQQQQKVAATWWNNLVLHLPGWSYRWRWPLVLGSLAMSAIGAVALFGLPGVVSPMYLETNSVEYIPHDSAMYKDTKEFEKVLGGLSIVNLWLVAESDGKPVSGAMTQPKVLAALDDLQSTLDKNPRVGSATSLPSILRMLRYLAGKGDTLPKDEEALEKITDDLENLLPREPTLQSFVEKDNLSQTHFAVVTAAANHEAFVAFNKSLTEDWKAVQARHPVLAGWKMRAVGIAPLQAKISHHMVPTLVESFVLTVGIIFITFLIVFRSGPARIMAMIPSVFAILVMFLFMRATGIFLNVATILIATTVLGTSENDQIHFFYHFQEARQAGGTVEQSLRHTLLISGRAIFFATLINAGGFLAFALATLPPIRQFGTLSSLAFVLSMIADFTALPASLWLLFRAKPDNR
jgi:hypothetical protein